MSRIIYCRWAEVHCEAIVINEKCKGFHKRVERYKHLTGSNDLCDSCIDGCPETAEHKTETSKGENHG